MKYTVELSLQGKAKITIDAGDESEAAKYAIKEFYRKVDKLDDETLILELEHSDLEVYQF